VLILAPDPRVIVPAEFIATLFFEIEAVVKSHPAISPVKAAPVAEDTLNNVPVVLYILIPY
jgi:hypothetical protein